jgi:hypothetical protein
VVPTEPKAILGVHGRQVAKIAKVLNLELEAIGISSEPAERWSTDIDHDLTKGHLDELASFLTVLQSMHS